ncbi:hypothetical protein BDR04DRAFT_875821 [Suillus decipiens]|nr:hypothetical protein BDR04DRAFT_875821 [Suillus decipiens]
MAPINTQNLRERFGRFRVLIMGRANAGKTTILQKIDVAIVTSSIKRGNHDIKNEMIFTSNPGFVFHDSCGFEAGSADEFESMKKFISERAKATKLEDRIHAIWYCIPMDDPWRTFQRSEEKFFHECDTGHIPVIVVFTKFEALRPIAFGDVKKEVKGLPGVLDRLCDPKNRACPKSHLRLDNMDKLNTNCNILLEHTALALDNAELQFCLISTQQSNLELCIKCAVVTLVDRAHSPFHYELDQLDIAKWFPQLLCLDGF